MLLITKYHKRSYVYIRIKDRITTSKSVIKYLESIRKGCVSDNDKVEYSKGTVYF